MTTTVENAPRPSAPKRPALRPAKLWLPVAAALAIIVFTMVATWVESPSPGSDSFLSPRASGGDGGAELAKRLEDEGVSVSRFTETGDAFFDAVSNGDSTVFLPAPDYLNGGELDELVDASVAPGTRLVFVDPGRRMLTSLGLIEAEAARIAPKVVEPGGGCDLAEATSAGKASMLRQSYTEAKHSGDVTRGMEWNFCYQGGLAWVGVEELSIVVPGAPAPFTDEYIGEANNAELATGLLGQHSRVLWLDKHSKTKQAPPSDLPTPDGQSPPSEPGGDPIDYPDQARTDPIYDAMPAWLWALLLGTLILGVGTALWKGRRLGPPVTEALPTTVPAAETVHGRARLYRRAHAYGETLRALRAGALHRMQPVLGLSSQASDAEVVEAVAGRTGWPSEYVTATLYGTRPVNEAQLFEATQAIDALVSAVVNANPQGSN